VTYTIPRPRIPGVALALASLVLGGLGCAHERHDPAAASLHTGAVSALEHDAGGHGIRPLAQSGPEGVRHAPDMVCESATKELVVIAGNRALEGAGSPAKNDEPCPVEFSEQAEHPRDLIALAGIRPGALEEIAPGLVEGGVAELAAVEHVARESEGELIGDRYVVHAQVRAFELHALRWVAVSLHYRPRPDCEDGACTFENRCASASQSAVVVYSWNKFARFRGEASLRLRYARLERATKQSEFLGLLDTVGMFAVEGAESPWLITSHRSCDGKDYTLVATTRAEVGP
jgi:hypothetical protein